jgi:virginiamycin B lyase
VGSLLEVRQLLSAQILEFSTPTPGADPVDIARGSDGMLWFTEPGDPLAAPPVAPRIGRINPADGSITEHVLAAGDDPQRMVDGPDGSIWFGDPGSDAVGAVHLSAATIDEYKLPSTNRYVGGLTQGTNGALWVAETGSGNLGLIDTTTGSVSNVLIPELPLTPTQKVEPGPQDMTLGPDLALWFTAWLSVDKSVIGRYDPANNQFTFFNVPSPGAEPQNIIKGPDGALWFTEFGTSAIGRLDPSTGTITERPALTKGSHPVGITVGPDNNIWFSEGVAGKIEMLDPHTLNGTELSMPNGTDGLALELARDPDGNIWFTDRGASKIGVVILNGASSIANPGGSPGGSMGGGGGPSSTAGAAPYITSAEFWNIRKSHRTKMRGIKLDFSEPLDPARASQTGIYVLLETVTRRRRKINRPVAVQVAYQAGTDSVVLTWAGRHSFGLGGQLTVVGTAPDGLSNQAGTYLDGAHQGVAGTNAVLVISRGARTIALSS